MGREIEIKIPLLKNEYEKIYDFITGKTSIQDISFGSVEKLFKQDEYYSLFDTHEERVAAGEPQVIRIRTENNGIEEKSFFTIKRKNRENGIELNKEDETYIENPDVLRDLFAISKYKCWFKKQKDAYSCHCKSKLARLDGVDFHLELEKVNGLAYVEIEVKDESCAADVVKAALNSFVKLLGLDPENKDSRSWTEIITGKIN